MSIQTTQDRTVGRRYDFILLFDVKDGNPNGDPDAGNLPRLDPETLHGLVTDGCLKRKVRNFIELARPDDNPSGKPEGRKEADQKDGPARHEIYVKHAGILADKQRRAFLALGQTEGTDSANLNARTWMCRNFYDVRAFGAVMTTGKAPAADDKAAKKSGQRLWNCGQVRGPVQMTFARSLDPVVSLEASITRVALTNAGDTGKKAVVDEEGEERAASGQMGRKSFVPYGLYLSHGFVSAPLAKDTGFSHADLDLLWEALLNMFEHDRSAARGLMATRKLYVFQHESTLGNAPAHRLFEIVEGGIKPRKEGSSPRSIADYDLASLDGLKRLMPRGILLRELVEEGLSSTPWTA